MKQLNLFAILLVVFFAANLIIAITAEDVSFLTYIALIACPIAFIYNRYVAMKIHRNE